MRDILHEEHRQREQIQQAWQALLSRHGYRSLDVPMVERRDLYLRKMGEELVGKVYEFTFAGAELALRAEWTASVLRAYVTHMQDSALPLRLSYSGPVFRYQQPQSNAYRQFVQTGGELIGGPPPYADAEVLALACAGLDLPGVTDYTIYLSHIGVVREVLSRLGLSERTQGLLMWSLEQMRSDGVDAVRQHLYELVGDPPIDPSLLEGLDDEQVAALLLRLLQAMQVDISYGTRTPEAIVRRLVRKLRHNDSGPVLERALDVLWRLSQIRGNPQEALAQVHDLLAQEGITSAALSELEAIVSTLSAHNLPPNQLRLDFGMGRGLHYYTGMIFEIYSASGVQLCGGGRYDDLVQVLGGGRAVPAVGFAYSLEQVIAAGGHISTAPEERLVGVVATNESTYSYALEVAQQLRAGGVAATVTVANDAGLDIPSSYIAQHTLDALVLVGADEYATRAVLWYDGKTGHEQRMRFDELYAG